MTRTRVAPVVAPCTDDMPTLITSFRSKMVEQTAPPISKCCAMSVTGARRAKSSAEKAFCSRLSQAAAVPHSSGWKARKPQSNGTASAGYADALCRRTTQATLAASCAMSAARIMGRAQGFALNASAAEKLPSNRRGVSSAQKRATTSGGRIAHTKKTASTAASNSSAASRMPGLGGLIAPIIVAGTRGNRMTSATVWSVRNSSRVDPERKTRIYAARATVDGSCVPSEKCMPAQ